MARILLVTNDFEPKVGGIQSYLSGFTSHLAADKSHSLTVLASDWKGAGTIDAAAPYPVLRQPSMKLPTARVAHRMCDIIRAHGIDTVWFGAAAPLAVLADRARSAGASRIVASTHGHEVGWAQLPPTRNMLRHIGDNSDAVTYVSAFARSRTERAFGTRTLFSYLPAGVDSERFTPDADGRTELRRQLRLGGRPTILCVSRLVPRKGQDVLIRALPQIRATIPGTCLVLVGAGHYRARLRRLAKRVGVDEHVVFCGEVAESLLPNYFAAADVFAMPCRTRAGAWDVEGLGIVFLEAAAAGLPVIAGRSGGAPETVLEGRTGLVVDGRNVTDVASAVCRVLRDPDAAAVMGQRGRDEVLQNWQWARRAEPLVDLLST